MAPPTSPLATPVTTRTSFIPCMLSVRPPIPRMVSECREKSLPTQLQRHGVLQALRHYPNVYPTSIPAPNSDDVNEGVPCGQ